LKQYQKLFELEKAKLTFTADAMKMIAKKAIEKKSGARGLRAIMESMLLDIMYDIPSQTNVEEVVINEDVVNGKIPPIIVFEEKAEKTA
jgi:ATP-dependent Clp protease ATP-binding subunit ClpX